MTWAECHPSVKIQVNLRKFSKLISRALITSNVGHRSRASHRRYQSGNFSIISYFLFVIFSKSFLSLIHKANDKMKRWNDYYDSMTPKKSAKKNSTSAAPSIELSGRRSHRFSVFARKSKQRHTLAVPSASSRHVTSAAAVNSQPERYIQRNDEIRNVSARVQQPMPESNFAWVD